jgi:leader peptidase (prepilin peptidase)/N-methyltransferase
VSSDVVGALVGAGGCLLASPYLARLTVTMPDRDATAWTTRWRGTAASRPRLAATAVAGLVLGALAGYAAGWTALLPAFLILALAGTALVVIDFEHHRLPNRLMIAGAIGAVLLTIPAAYQHEWSALLRAVEGGAAVFAALYLLILISPKSFGYGDVKLGGILGAYLGWFGWRYVYYGIFAGFLLGAVIGVAIIGSRRGGMKTAIPFGPMLIAGALIVLAFGLVPSTG